MKGENMKNKIFAIVVILLLAIIAVLSVIIVNNKKEEPKTPNTPEVKKEEVTITFDTDGGNSIEAVKLRREQLIHYLFLLRKDIHS